ncbi:hypothetical protein [Nocardia brevicatena]|uniref:hypothetical protein n=1 Tax=Nocardia brevicatena TaxID=37327 RepID=UPI001C3F375B|nr:hypothetical protein [Nocardia brevicatena]
MTVGSPEFLSDTVTDKPVTAVDGKPGTAIFFGAGYEADVARIISEVRVEAAKRAGIFDENVFRFCWVVDFSMHEKADDGRSSSPTIRSSPCPKVNWTH